MEKEISLEPFEVNDLNSKYLLTATADVWYDLTGTFVVYDIKNKIILHTIFIKDNSDKYEEVARFCFDYLLNSKSFALLKTYCDYEYLYEVKNNKPRAIIKPTKFLYDTEDEEKYYKYQLGFDYEEVIIKLENINIDLSNQHLGINTQLKTLPNFLTKWDGDSYNEIFIFDKNKDKFIYHLEEFCPYTNNDKDRIQRTDFTNSHDMNDNYELFTILNNYQSLWFNENEELSIIQKHKVQ